MEIVKKWAGRAVRGPGLLGVDGCFIPSALSMTAPAAIHFTAGSPTQIINSKLSLPGNPLACGSDDPHRSLGLC